MTSTRYTILSEKEAGKSTKEFSIEIGAEELTRYHGQALREITAETELPGFRKGKVPEKLVLEKVGSMHVLERAAEKAVNESVVSILAERQFSFIGQPSISITKLALGNPLQFTMRVSLVPDIELPDYKAIATEKNGGKPAALNVSDKELEEALTHIQKILGQQKQAGGKSDQTNFELTNETVKQLGAFDSLAAFKEKLKNDLLADKQKREEEKVLLDIVEAVVSKTKTDIPDALVEHELDRMETEFARDIERMGMKQEDYLQKIKKTQEELRSEWRKNAEKRATFELIIPKIAKTENIQISDEEINHETEHLLEHHKDADKESARHYVEKALMRQKVLDLFRKK